MNMNSLNMNEYEATFTQYSLGCGAEPRKNRDFDIFVNELTEEIGQ